MSAPWIETTSSQKKTLRRQKNGQIIAVEPRRWLRSRHIKYLYGYYMSAAARLVYQRKCTNSVNMHWSLVRSQSNRGRFHSEKREGAFRAWKMNLNFREGSGGSFSIGRTTRLSVCGLNVWSAKSATRPLRGSFSAVSKSTLQVNATKYSLAKRSCWKALEEIYRMYILLHLSNHKM